MENEFETATKKSEEYLSSVKELSEKIDDMPRDIVLYAALGGFLGFLGTFMVIKLLVTLSHIWS